jgi:hypothetical protein
MGTVKAPDGATRWVTPPCVFDIGKLINLVLSALLSALKGEVFAWRWFYECIEA